MTYPSKFSFTSKICNSVYKAILEIIRFTLSLFFLKWKQFYAQIITAPQKITLKENGRKWDTNLEIDFVKASKCEWMAPARWRHTRGGKNASK